MRTQPEYMSPAGIEAGSFAIIDGELAERGIVLTGDTGPVIRRCIHTTADFSYARTLKFSEGAVEKLKELIRRGAFVVTETEMARSGISKKEFARYGGRLLCFMADGDVADKAKERGVTRASVSMEKAAGLAGPVIFAVGNAPTALMTLKRMYDEGRYTPAFVIGVPVGFVNVEEAKESVLEMPVPYIVNAGRKGGSTVAAAVMNAVLYEMRDERS